MKLIGSAQTKSNYYFDYIRIPKMDVSWVGFMNSKYITDQGFI